MRLYIIVCMLLFFMTSFKPLPGKAQEPVFPTDLVFSAGRGNPATQDPHIPNIIARIDRVTLRTSIFYEDPTPVGLYPISWSPSGAYLAVFRIEGRAPFDL